MKQWVALLFFVSTFVSAALAQKADLWAKRGDNGLFLEHKVVAKESFFSIGRLYNVSPKFLAAYNKLDLNGGIRIDQKLRIPLTDTNFTQKGNSGTPVYYKTGDGDGLMKVSSANNNVSLAKLREWNDLSDDKPAAGKKLIVGFLQSREMPAITIKTNNKPKKEEAVTKTPDPIVTQTPVQPVVAEATKKEVKEESKEELKAEKKDEKKAEEIAQQKLEDAKKQEPVMQASDVKAVEVTDQGYFKTGFEQQSRNTPPSKDETVTAGIFKTTSGWQDAKYYLLMDAIQPGTIVKIVNPENNRAVYAKVLGQMSGIRQNEGLTIRISNAAAAALQIADPEKFIVKVNY